MRNIAYASLTTAKALHNGPGYRDYTFDQKVAQMGTNQQSHIVMHWAKIFPGHY